MVLSELKTGEKVKIKGIKKTVYGKIANEGSTFFRYKNDKSLNGLLKRLIHLGVTKGTTVEIIGYAPFGDPVQIKIRGYYIAIRKSVADIIEVE